VVTKKKKPTIKKKSTARAKKSSPTKPTKKPLPKKVKKPKRYYEAVGRRKKAVARVRLFTCQPFEGEKARILVNEKSYTDFFPTFELQQIVISPLQKMKSLNRFEVSVKVKGGGIRGQAEAIRHGLARALVKFNPDFRKKLKRAGYLRRDPRKKERKKPGLKKARRAPQWQKR
jgi:small subunit ribosomal protein S9